MNKKQREIIVDAYENYIKQGMRCDPIGGFSDMHQFFESIKETDKKLSDEMDERYDEIPE